MISRKATRRRAGGSLSDKKTAGSGQGRSWPVGQCRTPLAWYPAYNRLITLVRTKSDSFVLPPALVKKAAWRD
jgi:hypothetical protein